VAQSNLDSKTVEGFGQEWARFDQSGASRSELAEQFARYFSLFPWHDLPSGAQGFDLGCGSGRWARFAAPRVGKLFCIDASSEALAVAKRNLAGISNIEFCNASVDAIPLEDDSMDFGYSLGVLHHIPDTAEGIAACVRKIRVGAPFLIYLYYAFDNRPAWFRAVWRASDICRSTISGLPFGIKKLVTDLIACFIYFPLARLSGIAEWAGLMVETIPLSTYRRHSFYTMRTDALDRFGTRLEQRFTRDQILKMLISAGLENISFREGEPYWCAVGYRAESRTGEGIRGRIVL
jgi:SAM-dependent methyltransferase